MTKVSQMLGKQWKTWFFLVRQKHLLVPWWFYSWLMMCLCRLSPHMFLMCCSFLMSLLILVFLLILPPTFLHLLCILSLSGENVILCVCVCVCKIVRLLKTAEITTDQSDFSVYLRFLLRSGEEPRWELCASARATPSTGEGQEWPKRPTNVHVTFIMWGTISQSGFFFLFFFRENVKWVRNRGEIKKRGI